VKNFRCCKNKQIVKSYLNSLLPLDIVFKVFYPTITHGKCISHFEIPFAFAWNWILHTPLCSVLKYVLDKIISLEKWTVLYCVRAFKTSSGLSLMWALEQLHLVAVRIAADDYSHVSCSASNRGGRVTGFYVHKTLPEKRNLGPVVYIFSRLTTIMYLHFTLVKAVVCLRLSFILTIKFTIGAGIALSV
jgi:hypothetical protein